MENDFLSPLDCVVVGGGAAGLTAAIYLNRFCRTVLVIDSGCSRLSLIPSTQNYPGFPSGVNGQELLKRLHLQAGRFGASIRNGVVSEISKGKTQPFEIRSDSVSYFAKTVILATGSTDVVPQIEGHEKALKNAFLRYCPICDGFEAIGKKVAVLGAGRHGVNEAIFIHHYAKDLTYINFPDGVAAENMELLAERDIKIFDGSPNSLVFTEYGVSGVFGDGSQASFDVLYSALGLNPNNEMARLLKLHLDVDGQVKVDDHMQSSLEGFFAIGDVAHGLNQISVATGHAAIAATAVHNLLCGRK
ncbi:NAD(P)/FAD-dependent oxidoreductase [Acidovorax sp. LjRoot66]|uniref:NAD(P)/FAD-dependent oxidoreductase n=1 Tax=Acidovorax sp. LjRoot66 TaxID=3342334 RepID=UPI0015C76345